MPGLVSETYLRPAHAAASFGSTIVCTSAADSNTEITLSTQSKNLMHQLKFHRFSRYLTRKVGFARPAERPRNRLPARRHTATPQRSGTRQPLPARSL